MKQIKVSFALAALFGSMTLASCSSDDVVDNSAVQPATAQGFAPAKASDISFYSAGSLLTSTRATRVTDDPFKYYKVQDGNLPPLYQTKRPATVEQAEKDFVIKYVKEHKDDATVPFNYSNYFIQNIGSSKDKYENIEDQNHAKHSMVGGNHMDYLQINGRHINDYNATSGPDALILNLLMTDPTYHDSWGDKDQTKHDAYKIYKITYNGKEGFYLGFDYRTEKYSKEKLDGDGVYNDWVVKLTPADGTPLEPQGPQPAEPETPETPSTPETPGNPSKPTPPAIVTGNKGEVEVNLSLNEKKTDGDYIATKLSIHVRDTADVEVFIPVEAQYYCQADDMNIVLSHKKLAEQYNNSANDREMAWTVAGQTVKLTVSYATDGIRVKTQGVNKAVLKALREQYGDGITFEVWNYFKADAITREQLKPMLDKSTVSFTEAPGRYVNAFGALYDYTGKVYSKADGNGVWTPYTDEACSQELSSNFWRRDADGKYFLLNTHVNPLDCTVKPADTTFAAQGRLLYSPVYRKN